MNTKSRSLRRCLAGLLTVVAALSASAQTYVSYDFSASDQFTLDHFVLRNANSKGGTLGTATWSSSGVGSDGAAGRVNFAVTAVQEFSYYYTTAIAPGDGLVVSYDFLANAYTAGGLSRTGMGLSVIDPTIGTASVDLNLVQSTTAPQARLLKLAANTSATFEARGADNPVSDLDVTLTAGTWYTFTTTFIPNAELGIYHISSQLIDMTTGLAIATASGDTKVSVSGAYFSDGTALPVYVGILGQGEYGGAAAIDNFSISAAVVPEPSTYALLAGAGVLALAYCRRRY
jgi:hypothetical protein